MDRNTIIGIFLIGAVLVVFSLLNKPSKEQQEAMRHRLDSLKLLQTEQQLANQDSMHLADTSKPGNAVVNKSQDTALLRNEYGQFAQSLSGQNEFITIENNLIRLVVSAKGGRPYSVELKKYHRYDSLPLLIFTGDSTVFSLDFFAQNRTISTQNLYFVPNRSEKNITVKDSAETIRLRLNAGPDKYIDYVYTLNPNSYMVDFSIQMKGMNEIIASNANRLDLNWEIYSPQQEMGRKNEDTYTTLYYKYFEGDVESFNARSNKPEESLNVTNRLKWVAFKQQFFSAVIISKTNFTDGLVKSAKTPAPSHYLRKFSALVGIPYDQKPQQSIDLAFYFGPNHFNTLKKYNLDLQELVTVGKNIVKWINQFVIIPIFNFLNRFIGNYGLIILILTIIIKTVLMPLTYKSYMSMAKMRVLKPQVDDINEKFAAKDKAMEKQQAMMALYKKAGVNPMSGCLPMVLQMPILFAMFRFFPTSIELRQQPFLWAHDLSTYDSILTLPFTVPMGYGNHVSLFTILMTITTIISIKMNDQTTASSTQMPGMKTMMYIMPVMFMFILNSFSAALTYYYFLTNVITFAQNYMFKRFVNEEALLKQIHEKQKKPVTKSKFQQRLEAAAKQRGYKGLGK